MITELSFDQIEENRKEIIKLLRETGREGVEELIQYLDSTTFFTDPASANHHGAFKGGLALHSLTVYRNLKRYKDAKMFEANDDEIIIATLMHDVCKAGTYTIEMRNKKDESGKWIQVPFYTNVKTFPYGHGEKSVDILRDYIKLTVNEKLAIRYHMGAYESKECWNDLGYAQEISPMTLWIHMADVEASRYTA